ncbi:transcriptional regulator, AlpA family [Nitrosospira sp. Nl5]|nr:transcriptional regulator, AlpA family [Nitrosospira sp. Nl5]
MTISDDKLLRKKGVADMLGFSRHTLGRIMKRDPTFPRFIELAPGIRMVQAREIRIWIARKELEARERSGGAHSDTN